MRTGPVSSASHSKDSSTAFPCFRQMGSGWCGCRIGMPNNRGSSMCSLQIGCLEMEGAALEANVERSKGKFLHLASSLASAAFSCAALVLVFWGLFQLDLPIARYMRSVTVDYVWARDQILIPWMAVTSWAGDWIGEGTQLILLSA